jgi:hypothetical protein
VCIREFVDALGELEHALFRVRHLEGGQFDGAEQLLEHLGGVVFAAVVGHEFVYLGANLGVVEVKIELVECLFVFALLSIVAVDV